MLNFKLISTSVQDATLQRYKTALREFLEQVQWKGREQDLLLMDEATFLKTNSINDWFPDLIVLAENKKPRISIGNKHIYSQQDVLATVNYIKANPQSFFNKKENTYDYKEIRAKTKVSSDHFLYFVALAEEKSLIRFGYKNRCHLLPIKYAPEVISFLTGQKNMTSKSNIAERGQISTAIKEIKDQLTMLEEEHPEPAEPQNQNTLSQNRTLNEILHEETAERPLAKSKTAPKTEQKPETIEKITHKKPTTEKTVPIAKTPPPKKEKEIPPKDPLLEKVFSFLDKTGENVREKIYNYNIERATKATEQITTNPEFLNDEEFFEAAIADIETIELDDFFKPSIYNAKLTRLENLTKEFKNFTAPSNEFRRSKIELRQKLTAALLPKLKHELRSAKSTESLRFKKIEQMIEVILAFNDPYLAEELFKLIKEKLQEIGINSWQKELTRTAKTDLAEMRADLLIMQKMITAKFKGSFTTHYLNSTGKNLDFFS